MTEEVDRELNDRRALEERRLAQEAPGSVSAISHATLAKLHEDEAEAIGHPSLPQKDPVDVKAIDGDVVIVSMTGTIIIMTPQAALLTSDRLVARAREAGRQKRAS